MSNICPTGGRRPRLTGADHATPGAGGCWGGRPKVLPNWATRADTMVCNVTAVETRGAVRFFWVSLNVATGVSVA
jgi:hypothetical protein